MMRKINLFAAALAMASGGAALADDTSLMRGIVRAVDETWLSSDLGARIDTLPFKEGEAFRKGAIIIGFDCAQYQSQRKAAAAKLAGETATWKNNKELKAHGATGQFDVDLSKAKMDEAAALLDEVDVTLAKCRIAAPFDGRMAQLGVHLHETPERGARMMQILDVTALEVDMILPSSWLKWLKAGETFQIVLDETGTTVEAEVIRIAAAVDPVSQTVKVVGRLAGGQGTVLPGMSGPVNFRVPNG